MSMSKHSFTLIGTLKLSDGVHKQNITNTKKPKAHHLRIVAGIVGPHG